MLCLTWLDTEFRPFCWGQPELARLQFSMVFCPNEPYGKGFSIESALNHMHLKGTGIPW